MTSAASVAELAKGGGQARPEPRRRRLEAVYLDRTRVAEFTAGSGHAPDPRGGVGKGLQTTRPSQRGRVGYGLIERNEP